MRTPTTAGVLAGLLLLTGLATAQDFAPERGLRHVDPRWHALVNATLIPEPGARVEDATVVVRDGVIVSVGAGDEPPAGARVWDCEGLTIYAGFVDPEEFLRLYGIEICPTDGTCRRL